MIQSATFKLTLWYLGIILLLSLLFSVALYNVSDAQLTENVSRQRSAITRLALPIEFEPRRSEFLTGLADQLDQDRRRVLVRLLALNTGMLLLGGGASYLLARRTLRPIEDALDAQGRFTGDASHELRTPLTVMRSEIEVALREKQLTTSDARSLLASNLEEIAKLEALSGGLLKLAQTGSDLDPTAIKQVAVEELFEDARSRFKHLIDSRDVQVVTKISAKTVLGDQDSLTELVAILLDNAIKYSPKGSTITLASNVDGHSVRLSIKDQGIGMKASDIPHIFDRFYRSDRSRSKDKVDGYGLGLSIAKRIVDVHHGTIMVDSEIDKGSTFRVKLPQQPVRKTSLFS